MLVTDEHLSTSQISLRSFTNRERNVCEVNIVYISTVSDTLVSNVMTSVIVKRPHKLTPRPESTLHILDK